MYRFERKEEGGFRLFITAAAIGDDAPPLKRWKGDSSWSSSEEEEVNVQIRPDPRSAFD